MPTPQLSAVPRAVRSKSNQTGRQVAERIACKILQQPHCEAFNQILRELSAEAPRGQLRVLVHAFIAELRAELKWYEEKGAVCLTSP